MVFFDGEKPPKKDEIRSSRARFFDTLTGEECEYERRIRIENNKGPVVYETTTKRACMHEFCPMLRHKMRACPLDFCPLDFPLSIAEGGRVIDDESVVEKED